MIGNPLAVAALLAAVEALVLVVSSRPRFKKYFSFLPPVFWIYFLPMLLATAGILDPASAVYPLITNYFLPASLVLLLLCSDVRQVLKLGKNALVMMCAGAFGIMLGTTLVVSLFKNVLDPQAWSGFGAISGSWTGGSANMIAVKEVLGTPERIFTPMVIVDTIVPYTWMGVLVALAGFQAAFDRWNKSDSGMLDELNSRVGAAGTAKTLPGIVPLVWIAAIAVGGMVVSRWVSGLIPEIPNVLSRYGWMIICVSCIGIGLSFTRARGLERAGANDIGYYLLYFVLASIGAKASLRQMDSALILIAAGFLIVLVHALVLFVTARLIRAPLFLAAAASQANIGGVASAPVVAATYQPGLASVGLLMAILGNIIGTYIGILTGRICWFLQR